MSQHDYNIANGGGAAVRADLNNALLAVLSQNSGATAPTTTKPFMFWYDTTTGVLKMRNAADTAWVDAITGVSGGNGLGMVNRVINGRCEIDQRNAGASITVAAGGSGYGVDRFFAENYQSGTITIQRSTDAPTGFINSLLHTVSSTDTPASGDYLFESTSVEGLNMADLGWGTANAQAVTLSFWVKSSITGTYGIGLRNSAGNRSYVATYTVNAADTWEQKTVNIAGDTSGTWLTTNGLGVRIFWDLGSGSGSNGTANTWNAGSYWRTSSCVNWISNSGATWRIAGVDLRKGTFTSAPAWDYRPYGTELALCQRYAIVYGRDQAYNEIGGTGFAYGTTAVNIPVCFPVSMRSTPTVTTSGSFQLSDGASGSAASAMGVVTSQSSTLIASIGMTSSGLTTYRPYRIETANSTTAYALFSAEL